MTASLPPAAVEWFGRRGITLPTLERNRIRVETIYFPQTGDERLAFAFPLMQDGAEVGCKYRGRTASGETIYRHDGEGVLFGLDHLDSRRRHAYHRWE